MYRNKSFAWSGFISILGLLALLAGCSQADENRILSYQAFMAGPAPNAPVDYREMALPENASLPAHVFSGRLELLGESDSANHEQLTGWYYKSSLEQYLPEFDFAFVQDGSHLIPLRRGRILTIHPTWNYILEPGRVWQEPGDHGFSRASFPFALIEKNGNSVFNGVMTFLFDDQEVSQVWYQVTQETAIDSEADWWGMLKAVYHPEIPPEAEQIRRDFAAELSARLPVRPLKQLEKDYPGVDTSRIGSEITPGHVTAYGMIVDGVNYLAPCRTRSGDYPYCEEMRLPSFSTSKSAFVAVALMRLTQEYGSEVPELLVRNYLPETADSPGDWSRVTFNNILDMSTGNYSSAEYMKDESSSRTMTAFFGSDSYAEKMDAALGWPAGSLPGKSFVYHSTDSFLLSSAMQNFLKSRRGQEAELFNYVVDEVYRPLGIGSGFFSTLRTSEKNWNGQAIGSFGLWWTPSDVAEMAVFLNNLQGAHSGEQLLDPNLLDSALQRNPADPGVAVDERTRYNNGFWADQFSAQDGYRCTFWVPYMSGYTGITIALLPDGITYYYFSDNYEFAWANAVREADKIRPFCP